MIDEKRSFQRISFDASATLSNDKGSWGTQVVDICLKGMLVKKPDALNVKKGDELNINITLIENDVIISMDAVVVHIDDDHLGFERKNLDMDSSAHLRRLVELNLGDSELLERELAELF